MLSLRTSAHTGVAIPRIEGKCTEKHPKMGTSAIFGGNRYLVPFNRGIATTSLRTGLAMTGNLEPAQQTPIKVIGLKQQTRKLLFTQKGCHPERAQRVEGSTHFVSLSGKFSAKILRLRCAIFIVGLPPAILIMEIRLRYAQDDRVFCCLRLCAKQQFAGLLRKADSLNTNLFYEKRGSLPVFGREQ